MPIWVDIGDDDLVSDPSRARSLVARLLDRCDDLALLPERFPLLPQRAGTGIRRRVHGDYLIFYRAGPDRIDVLHILHGARDYEAILLPEG